jgi:nucleoid-associated protein YgaU
MIRVSQRCLVSMIGVVVSLLLLGTTTSFAQSLGDIARQERERKQNEPQRETHVYTNDDLQKPHILVPEDQVRALAARRATSAPTVAATVPAAPVPVAALAATPVLPAITPLPALPASAPTQPAPGATPGVAEVPVQDPATSISNSPSRPEPQRVERTAFAPAPRTALVSSPSGWKIVYAEPVSAERRIAAPVIPTPTPTPTPTPKLVPAPVAKPRRTVDTRTATDVQIQRGDSLWKLAKKYLGSGLRWHELAALNPEVSNPDILRIGESIHLPNSQARPLSAKQFVIHSGDTLWSVARAEFGTSRAFPCIASANPQLQSPDRIRAGDSLILPQACALAR